MKKKVLSAVVLTLFCLLLGSAGPVLAENSGTIELRTVVEKEVFEFNEEGRKVLVRKPAGKVIPGDEVVYTIFYTNTGQDPADKIVITNPVPEHMVYKMDSAAGKGCVITFSVDKGKTYNTFEDLRVTSANGTLRPPLVSELTHIHWTVTKSLPPGQKGFVVYRATLQ